MLETLLYPKAVAVIGASRNPDKVGYAVVANLVNSGFKGPIVPVNPEAKEILGLKCYKSIDDYKGKGPRLDEKVESVERKLGKKLNR